MAKYAKNTKGPASKTRVQVQNLLIKYGIEEFYFGTSPRGEGVGFKYEGRTYKHNVPMPDPKKSRSDNQYKQAVRQRWRLFYMSLKMKLDEVQGGGVSFEDQFLAMMSLPDGSTVGDFMKLPENVARLEKSKMPKLLTS